MKCPYCYAELPYNATVCPYCGASVPNNSDPYANQQNYNQTYNQQNYNGEYNQQNYGQQYSQPNYNQPYYAPDPDATAKQEVDTAKTLGIVALIAGILFCTGITPIAAWICGGIGLSKAKKYTNRVDEIGSTASSAKKMCLAGIIIPCVFVGLIVIYYIICFFFGLSLGFMSFLDYMQILPFI